MANSSSITLRAALAAFTALSLVACTSSETLESAAHINSKTKFSSSTYGVAASPRLTTSKRVRKGGGRRQVGKPYKIRGKWYTPREEHGYDRKGKASWYGPNFHGRLTANGEIYDQYGLSAAHPTFPLPSYARVTNRDNGKSVIVRVNDRGPYHDGRIIDLSARAAKLLAYANKGIGNVRVEYIGQAPLHGQDESYLVASFNDGPGFETDQSSVLVAMAPSPQQERFESLRQRLDTMPTGSIAPAAQTETRDYFGELLEAVKRKRSDNTTLALRLSRINATR